MIKIVIVKLINWLSRETKKNHRKISTIDIIIIFFNNQLTLSRRSI